MRSQDTLHIIKSVAKRVARAQNAQHIVGLETAAQELGHPHWRGLAEAFKKGWRPTPEQMEKLSQLALSDYTAIAQHELGSGLRFTRWSPENLRPMDADEIEGILDGHEFYLAGDNFEVGFGSQGWEIIMDQPPSAKPELRRLRHPIRSVASLDPTFVERATILLKIRAQRMHAEVVADWPISSTMPDKDGNVEHPLGNGTGSEWHCLHCDAAIAGPRLAANLWHCPECGASPIDIFREPFWREEKQAS